MRKLFNSFVGVGFVVFLVAAYPAKMEITRVVTKSSPYIEVCGRGIVYLPPGTKFVTCHGKVMEVIAIVPLVEGAQVLSDCNCPNCCGGVCTVTVRCEPAPEASAEADDCQSEKKSSSGGGLCTAYIAC